MFELEESGTVTTAVRVRPFSQREIDSKDNYSAVDCPEFGKIRCSKKGLPPVIFSVDHTFCYFADDVNKTARGSQQEVYEALGVPLLNKALAGYNACLLAYGVTTSGKTYSMYGTADDPGIVPRIVKDLFARINAEKGKNVLSTVYFNYYEIYNEKINDLLQDKKNLPQLTVREHPVTGPFVEGLIQPAVHSSEETFAWLRRGDARRSVAPTEMNTRSSRSHTIASFVIRRELVSFTNKGTIENGYTSKLTLVDLAGSERQSSTNGLSERLMETCQINKSLFVLGRVISQLSGESQAKAVFRSTERFGRKRPKLAFEGVSPLLTPQTSAKRKNNTFVSYRDSLLTWLLKDSLGGNSVTTMLATVSPSSLHIDDTLSTLHYAKRAQCIVNKAVVNEDPEGRIIRELMAEVEKLRRRLDESTKPNSPSTTQVRTLKRLLLAREEEIAKLTNELTKRTAACARLHVEALQTSVVSSPTVETTSRCLYDGDLSTKDSCKISMKRFKRNLFSEGVDSSTLSTSHRVAPEGAEKGEFVVQAGIPNCDSNRNSPKNQTTEPFATVNKAVGPSEIILREDASTNTREDTTVIPLSDLDKMQSDLRALTEALSVYRSVQKADASSDVCEQAFGLSVLPADVAKCEVETCTDDRLKRNVATSDHLNHHTHPRTSIDQFNEELGNRRSLIESRACVDSTTWTDDYELGVTYISLNFFNELYEKQHLLRLGFSSQESKPKSDASVATDLGATLFPEEDFKRLHCQIEQLKAEICKYEAVGADEAKHIHNGGGTIENPAVERTIKDMNGLGPSLNPADTPIGPAHVAAAGNAPSRHSSVKAITKDYVHNRVDFFENLNRSQMIFGECPAQASSQNLCLRGSNMGRQRKDELISDEDLGQNIKLLQYQVESQRWEIQYLEKLNERLKNERNMIAKVLKGMPHERNSSPSDVLPLFDELLQSISQISDEFRREMASILEKYGCDTNKLPI
ncbi:Kinesin-like protein KIF13A [Taenia crassiceps]|uniref:Kinesin-like protein n=1 Tax=Taenia crassiceps TaxID=6207 RepID=A0ABR4QDB6_9CEST